MKDGVATDCVGLSLCAKCSKNCTSATVIGLLPVGSVTPDLVLLSCCVAVTSSREHPDTLLPEAIVNNATRLGALQCCCVQPQADPVCPATGSTTLGCPSKLNLGDSKTCY